MQLRMGGFLLLSVVAHGVLLPGLWPDTPARLGETRVALQLRMVANPTTAEVAAAASMPAAPASQALAEAAATPQHRTSPPAALAATQTVSPPPSEAITTARKHSSPTPPAAVERAAAQSHGAQAYAQLQKATAARIHQRLTHSFQYPAIARRKGWQGDVTLSIRVEADGRLSRIQLLSSSGHHLLDRSALQAAQAIRILDRLALSVDHLDLVVPVQYRLLGG